MGAGAPRPVCDFCGRSESDILLLNPGSKAALELDADELWVCQDCRAKLLLPVVGEQLGEVPPELNVLIGQSAGAICYTLNLPYKPPYRTVIDAASKIAYDEDRYMSTWSFVAQWPDGTTIWRAEDGKAEVTIAPDGSVRFYSMGSP